MLLAFEKKFSHCVIFLSRCVKEIERDGKRAEVLLFGSGLKLRRHQW